MPPCEWPAQTPPHCPRPDEQESQQPNAQEGNNETHDPGYRRTMIVTAAMRVTMVVASAVRMPCQCGHHRTSGLELAESPKKKDRVDANDGAGCTDD